MPVKQKMLNRSHYLLKAKFRAEGAGQMPSYFGQKDDEIEQATVLKGCEREEDFSERAEALRQIRNAYAASNCPSQYFSDKHNKQEDDPREQEMEWLQRMSNHLSQEHCMNKTKTNAAQGEDKLSQTVNTWIRSNIEVSFLKGPQFNKI